MIEINVAQLLKEPQGSARRYELDEDSAWLGEPNIVGPLHGGVSLVRTGRGIVADCRFETALTTECGRCVEPTTVPVQGRFQEEFLQTVDVRSGAPLTEVDDADADAFTIDDQHSINIGEAIRQHVLMAAPLQPLCQAECRGLCAHCGKNLNEGECGCAQGDEASPFYALRQLLDDSGAQANRA